MRISEEHRVLVDRYVDDLSSPEEAARLNQLLSEHPEVAEYFAEMARLNVLLLENGREAVALSEDIAREQDRRTSARRSRPISRPISRRRRGVSGRHAPPARRGAVVSSRRTKRRRAYWALPVAVVAAGLFIACLLLAGGGEWKATLVSSGEGVRIRRGNGSVSARNGAEIRPGDLLETGKGDRARVKFSDGTVLEVNRATELFFGRNGRAKQISVEVGDLYLDVTRQKNGNPLVVNPRRADMAVVLGTSLEVSRRAESTTLRVAQGSVRFGSGRGAVKVETGNASEIKGADAPSSPAGFGAARIACWRDNWFPVARGKALEAREDSRREVVLEASDGDGDKLSFRVETPPQHGRLEGQAPNLTYVPAADFNGEDRFTFSAFDGKRRSAPAEVKVKVVAVNDAPRAIIAADRLKGPAPLRVKFSGHDSSDRDGNVVAHRWDFGDRKSGQGATTEHLYAQPGRYIVHLEVTDDGGDSARAELAVTVTADPNAIARPGRPALHYKLAKGSFISWQDKSDNEEGFRIERAHDPDRKGRDLKWEVMATVSANVTYVRIQPTSSKLGMFRYRIVAFNKKAGRSSPPSAPHWIGWGGKNPIKGKERNWPPRGYRE